jgi:hypothetical protein
MMLILGCISFIARDLFQPLSDLNQKMNEIMENNNKNEDVDLDEG